MSIPIATEIADHLVLLYMKSMKYKPVGVVTSSTPSSSSGAETN